MKSVVLVLLSAVFFLLPAAALASGPKIVVEDADFNFGEVFQGRKLDHTFRFRNAGDATLVVDKVRSSCGCTAALLSSQQIPPGGSGEIRTTFDSGRFRGLVVKTIYLYVNDPQQPVAQFHLRGTVKPELVMAPEQADFGRLTPGRSAEVRITLTNQGEQEITLATPETTSPELQAELTGTSLPVGSSVQLLVKAKAREGKPRLSGYVMIKTSSPQIPELRLPVHGLIGDGSSPR